MRAEEDEQESACESIGARACARPRSTASRVRCAEGEPRSIATDACSRKTACDFTASLPSSGDKSEANKTLIAYAVFAHGSCFRFASLVRRAPMALAPMLSL